MIELHDQLLLAALSESRTLFEPGLIIVLAAAARVIGQPLSRLKCLSKDAGAEVPIVWVSHGDASR